MHDGMRWLPDNVSCKQVSLSTDPMALIAGFGHDNAGLYCDRKTDQTVLVVVENGVLFPVARLGREIFPLDKKSEEQYIAQPFFDLIRSQPGLEWISCIDDIKRLWGFMRPYLHGIPPVVLHID